MNITHGLRRALQINPNGLATVYGQRRRDWGELGERVTRLAGGLRTRGVRDGDRIAVLSFNSDRYLELYLATGWAGGVIVPLNIRWSALENEDALRDCRASVLVVDKAFAQIGAQLAGAIPGLKLIYADDGEVPAGDGELRGSGRGQRAGCRCHAQGRRSRRHLLHRRHHRTFQGRDAQPPEPDGQCAQRPRRRAVSGEHDLSARRPDVPPRQRGGDVFPAALRRLQRDRSGLHARRRHGRDAERARHRRAAGAHDDPDAGRSPRDRQTTTCRRSSISSTGRRQSARPCSTVPRGHCRMCASRRPMA